MKCTMPKVRSGGLALALLGAVGGPAHPARVEQAEPKAEHPGPAVFSVTRTYENGILVRVQTLFRADQGRCCSHCVLQQLVDGQWVSSTFPVNPE